MANSLVTWWNGKKKKELKTFTYSGIKNNRKTKYRKFIKICRMTQPQLKRYLTDVLRSAGYDPIVEDGFVYAKGSLPVLLTAHMDTVHEQDMRDFYEDVREDGKHVLSSPQGIGGDDRCGIYMIYKIITKTEMRPSILFCEDEEIGGIGSDKFCRSKYSMELDDMKFLIELDRTNGNDAVFYNCDNTEFTDFIITETGYKEAWGSFSDISNLSPECGVASVNLSCGYYGAHTLGEYVVMEEMENTIEVVKHLLNKAQTDEVKQFEYIEAYDDWGWNYGYGYKTQKQTFVILWEDKGVECETKYSADCEEFALYQFFVDNPTVCYNDVLAVYEEWNYEKNYASY